jgi:hypothetical protein
VQAEVEGRDGVLVAAVDARLGRECSPWAEAISSVRSVDPESSTTTSTPSGSLARQRPRRASSLRVMMTAESFTSER